MIPLPSRAEHQLQPTVVSASLGSYMYVMFPKRHRLPRQVFPSTFFTPPFASNVEFTHKPSEVLSYITSSTLPLPSSNESSSSLQQSAYFNGALCPHLTPRPRPTHRKFASPYATCTSDSPMKASSPSHPPPPPLATSSSLPPSLPPPPPRCSTQRESDPPEGHLSAQKRRQNGNVKVTFLILCKLFLLKTVITI